MKKSYFILAAVAATFAACSQNDDVTQITDAPVAIGFDSQFVESVTRSENNTQGYTWNLEDHHTTFGVWGYKIVNSTPSSVFAAQTVEWDNITANDWDYENHRFWDKGASSYEFYAAAPATAGWKLNANTTAANDDYFTLTGFTLASHDATTTIQATAVNSFATAAVGKDLLIAAPCTWTNYTTKVQLNFIHILSRLNVLIKKGDKLTDNDKVYIQSLVVNGFKSTGSFDEHAAAAVNTTPGTAASGTDRWDALTGTVNYTGTFTAETAEAIDKTNAKYYLQSLVIPQTAAFEAIKVDGTDTATAPELVITYQIHNDNWTGDKTETYTAHYNLAACFGKTTGETIDFNEGWQNNLTLIINPNAIMFDANVSPWSDGSANNFVIE